MLLLILVASLSAAAPLAVTLAEGCATEISMFCSGREDVAACLKGERENLTARCQDALEGRTPSSAGTSAPTIATPPAEGPTPDAAPVPGVANVWFEAGYSGSKAELLPKFTGAIAAEVPGALGRVSKLLGQAAYARGFVRPLMIRVEYDPTQLRGLASLDPMPDSAGRLRLTFNLAHWEDCPSRDILRSVVTHELSHAVLHDMIGEGKMSVIPQWFDEGLATLAGGEPARSIALDAAYARHGRGYPGAVNCPFDNQGVGWAGVGMVTECYPYYMLAVEGLAESSPDAIAGILADLRAGVPMESAVSPRAAKDWSSFMSAAAERTRRVVGGKTMLSLITGKGWWRSLRWCRG